MSDRPTATHGLVAGLREHKVPILVLTDPGTDLGHVGSLQEVHVLPRESTHPDDLVTLGEKVVDRIKSRQHTRSR